MAVGASFASLADGQNNTAEQTWLERVIQEMYDIVQQTPLYQSWTSKALAGKRTASRASAITEGLLIRGPSGDKTQCSYMTENRAKGKLVVINDHRILHPLPVAIVRPPASPAAPVQPPR